MLLLFTSGCGSIREHWTQTRYRVHAHNAWYRHRSLNPKLPVEPAFVHDFRKGWQEGYFDVADRGREQVPVVAPPRYWGSRYENPHGHQAMEAWLMGFRHGAFAAHQDGIDTWAILPISEPYEFDESTLGPDDFAPPFEPGPMSPPVTLPAPSSNPSPPPASALPSPPEPIPSETIVPPNP